MEAALVSKEVRRR